MSNSPYDPTDFPDTFSEAKFYYFVEKAIPVTADTKLGSRSGRPPDSLLGSEGETGDEAVGPATASDTNTNIRSDHS